MDWHVKDIELHFVDWFCATFGCEPGHAPERIVIALQRLLAAVPKSAPFDLAVLDAPPLTSGAAFLLTECLARMGAVRHGIRRRQAVLTPNGRRLAAFLERHGRDEILEMFEKAAPRLRCLPNLCNCVIGDCRSDNAFWDDHIRSAECRPVAHQRTGSSTSTLADPGRRAARADRLPEFSSASAQMTNSRPVPGSTAIVLARGCVGTVSTTS